MPRDEAPGGLGIDPDELANVVPLRPDADCGPLRTQPRERPWCRHMNVTMDTSAKRVYCRECGLEVPPFQALENFVDDYERYLRSRDHAIKECHRAEAELIDLERQIRNARARLRRATA